METCQRSRRALDVRKRALAFSFEREGGKQDMNSSFSEALNPCLNFLTWFVQKDVNSTMVASPLTW